MSLFDKITGTYTSYNSTSIIDTSKTFKVDQLKNWFILIDNVEYKITSNTTNTITFDNTLSSLLAYSISFVGRNYLNEIDSCLSDTIKINDDLISKKYNQTNTDLYNKVFVNFREYNKQDFNIAENILNLYVMQRTYAYYMLYLIFTDLMISQDTFNSYKREDFYMKYKDTLKDGLALLQLDFNKNGTAEYNENNQSFNQISFIR